jgi:hypothetical protein
MMEIGTVPETLDETKYSHALSIDTSSFLVKNFK